MNKFLSIIKEELINRGINEEVASISSNLSMDINKAFALAKDETLNFVIDAAKKIGFERPQILGVSILTSFGQRTLTEEIKVNLNIDDYALELSKIAKDSGLDGVLSASADVASIKAAADRGSSNSYSSE